MNSLIRSKKHRTLPWILALSSIFAAGAPRALTGAAQVQERGASLPAETGIAEPLPAPMPVVEEPPVDSSMLGSGARTMGALIVVLGLIWVAMVLLKRVMPHRFGPLGHRRRIEVLETLPIGEKRSLTLVRVNGEGLLLASTPGSISLIKEIRLERDSEGAPEARSAVLPVAPSFSDTLADETRFSAVPPIPGPLARLTLLRRDLETR